MENAYVSLSSVETKYIRIIKTAKNASSIRTLLTEFGLKHLFKTIICMKTTIYECFLACRKTCILW